MNLINSLLYLLFYLYVVLLPLIPSGLKFKEVPVSVDILLLLIIIVYILEILIFKPSRVKFKSAVNKFFNDKLGIFMFMLFCIMFLSTMYAYYKTISISESLRFLTFIILLFIIKYRIVSDKLINNFIKIFSCNCIIVGLFGIFQYFTKFNLDNKFISKHNLVEITRITSTFGNPNSYGAFLIIAFFPMLMMCIYGKNKINKYFYGSICVLLFFNIILTGSRNAELSIIIGCLVLAFVYNWKITAIIVPLSCLAFIVPKIRYRIVQKLSITQNMDRISLWKAAVKMIKENPLLGIGNGNYVNLRDSFVRRYPKLYYRGVEGYPTHNSYLKIQSELGIFGIVIFVILLLIIIYRIRLFIKNTNDNLYKAFFQGVFACTIAFLFMNIFDNLLFVPQVAAFFWMLIALEESINDEKVNMFKTNNIPRYNRRLCSSVLCIIFILGMIKGIAPFANKENKNILSYNIKNYKSEKWPLVQNKKEYKFFTDKILNSNAKPVDYSNCEENYNPFGDYLSYGKLFKNSFKNSKFDDKGLIMSKYDDSYYYNPVIISKYALTLYGMYINGENTKQKFLKVVDGMMSLQKDDGSFRYDYAWKYYMNKDEYKSGWASSILQGEALSVFARAYKITKDEKYLIAGDKTLKFLLTPIDEGGVMSNMKYLDPSLSKYVFFEEYLTEEKSAYTLNGFMYCLIGLYDWWQTNPDSKDTTQNTAKVYFDEGIETLKHILPYYNLNGISTFDLTHVTYEDNDPHMNTAYNSLHAYLLKVINSIHKDTVFKYYGDLWTKFGQK